MQLNNLFFAMNSMHKTLYVKPNNVKKYYGNRRERFISFYCSIYRMRHTLRYNECFKKHGQFVADTFHA